MIHVTDSKSDDILAVVTQRNVMYNNHKQSIKDYLETFDFEVFGDKAFVEHLSKRNRVIIPDEDEGYKEFIIHQLLKEKGGQHRAEVYTVGSYLELKKAKVIDPIVLSEYTPTMHVSFATNGTEWRPGIIEGSGYRTQSIETPTNPFEYLKRIANEFGLELRFRVETDGNKVTGRYVDLLERNGAWNGREVTFGKDLKNIRRKEDFSNIYTALKGYGPEREDGTRLEVFVEDEDALQRWGRPDPLSGILKHLVGVYEPQSDRAEMTEEELIRYTRTELNKRINSVVEYEVDVVDLENVPGMENKKIRFGDTIRIKDEKFNPALYLEARVHTQERDIFSKANKKIELGDYTEYTEEEVNAIWKQLQKAIQRKISMSDLLEVTYTKDIIDQKDVPGNQAKEKLDREVGEAIIETTTGSSEKAQEAENNAKDYVDLREIAINQKLLEKADLTYVDGQLAYKADSEVVQAINNTVEGLEQTTDDLLQSVADNLDALTEQGGRITTVEADLDEVEGQLSVALTDLSTLAGTVSQQGTQISANTEAISLKAEKSEVEGLQEELDGLSYENRNLIIRHNELVGVMIGASGETQSREETSTMREFIKVTPGEILTFSQIKTVEDDGASTNYFRYAFYDEPIDSASNVILRKANSSEIFHEEVPEGAFWLRVSYFTQNSIKVERGSKATPYSRAPEDIIADIDAVGSHVTNISAELDVLAGEVSAKAERSELQSLEGNVTSISNDLASLSVAYDGITADISSLEATTNGLTTDISNLNTEIQAVAGEVSTKVSAEYVTGAIADINIGGRNYVKNGNFSRGNSEWDLFENLSQYSNEIISGETPVGEYYVKSIGYVLSRQYLDDMEEGTYTASAYVKVVNNPMNRILAQLRIIDSDNNIIGSVTQREVTSGWVRIQVTFEGKPHAIQVRSGGTSSDFSGDEELHWTGVQLERGNKITDWSPAPEDVQAEIDSVYSYASSEISQLSGRIDLKADSTTVSGLSNRVTSAELAIDGLEGAITSKVSEGDVRSIFTQEASSFTFSANQINFDGHVFGGNATFEGNIVGANIIGSVFTQDSSQSNITLDDEGLTVTEKTNREKIHIGIKQFGGHHGGDYGVYFVDSGNNEVASLTHWYDQTILHSTAGLTLEGKDFGVIIDGSGSPSSHGVTVRGGLRVTSGFIETSAVDTAATHIYMRASSNGEARATVVNSTSRFIPIRGDLFYNEGHSYYWTNNSRILSETSSNRIYLQVNGQVRATRYMSGTLIPMYASSFNDGSLAETKTNIEPLELDALDVINNQMDLWEYNLKSELEDGINRKRIGFVIGEGYKTPEILLSSDGEGIEGYAHRTLNTKAIHQLSGIVDEHSDELNFLRMEIQYLRGVIEQLREESE